MSRAIRVAVANQPRLMRDLIGMSLACEQDIEIVATVADEGEIPRIVDEIAPEFLIVALESRKFGSAARQTILQKYPHMQIVALAADGNSFTLFSASDGIRSVIYSAPEAEILNVIRTNSLIREGQ